MLRVAEGDAKYSHELRTRGFLVWLGRASVRGGKECPNEESSEAPLRVYREFKSAA
jgi:hypothetical protein